MESPNPTDIHNVQDPVRLQILMFGPLEVRVNGAPLPALRTRKGSWLLALLVLNYPKHVERSWLAATLWPDSNDREALRNVRTSLYDLRKAFGDQGKRLLSPTPGTLGLDLSGAEVDLLAFDASIASKDFTALVHAVSQYRGSLLDGCHELWVLPERIRREQACLEALEALAEIESSAGRLAHAIKHLQMCVRLEPMRETAHQLLINALATLGDYAGAIQVYREFRLQLHEHLQTMPSADTTALYQQVRLRSRQSASGFNLKTKPEIPDEHPVYNSLETVDDPQTSHNLPRAVTTFVGRNKEIDQVRALLQASPLLTLTGSGGCGKTRLALQVAADLKQNFPDGVWFVELAPVADPNLILQAVASVFSLREQPGTPLLETVLKALAPRNLLLVLDNCEHLLPDCAQFVATAMRTCPHVLLLVTSRERLGISGEQTYRVPSLILPDMLRPISVANLENVEAVRLFVERARLSQPGFVLNEQNAMKVASVCNRLDGIPLALELAAARMRALSLEDIDARLDRRFSLLTGGDRTALPRHQTLRAMLDWSYDLLSTNERLLLQRLSVFPGGWSLEAAEQIASGEPIADWEVLDLLISLVDKSLVLAEERDGWVRYRMFETLRQYAFEKLESSTDLVAFCERRRDWYCKLATDGFNALRLGVEHNYWIKRLEIEHDNIRAVLAWPSPTEVGAEADLMLAANMWRFWFLRGYSSEGRLQLRRVLARQEGAQSKTTARAWALGSAANLADNQGDYASAWALYQESLTIRKELANENADIMDQRAIGRDYNSLGSTAAKQGNTLKSREMYEASRNIYKEVLHACREAGSLHQAAEILEDLGLIAQHLAEFDAAEEYHAECLAVCQNLNEKRGISNSLRYLGQLAASKSDFSKARALYEDCLLIQKELGNARGIAISYEELGRIALLQCDCSGAGELYRSALLGFSNLGDRQRVAICLEGLAAVLLEQGRAEDAVRRLGCASALHDIIGTPVRHHERPEYERVLNKSRLEIGDDPFEIYWSEGQLMTWEQIVSSIQK